MRWVRWLSVSLSVSLHALKSRWSWMFLLVFALFRCRRLIIWITWSMMIIKRYKEDPRRITSSIAASPNYHAIKIEDASSFELAVLGSTILWIHVHSRTGTFFYFSSFSSLLVFYVGLLRSTLMALDQLPTNKSLQSSQKTWCCQKVLFA